MKVNMHEAKSQLSRLGEKVWAGETVVIARAGKPYLDLLPHKKRKLVPRKPGRYKGRIRIPEDFNRSSEKIIAVFSDEKITRYGIRVMDAKN
jgi:antitoxin (DNA-binding transcriptional repressor) of toxin-antitoxin stability system